MRSPTHHMFTLMLVGAIGASALTMYTFADDNKTDTPTKVQTHSPTDTLDTKQKTRPGDDSYNWDYWRKFWSFKPVERPAIPKVKKNAWVRNPIDAFILAKLEANDVDPAPPADKFTWLRRVTFLLTGLPPTSAEIEAFLEDESDNAHDKVVNRLLKSPHYGERMGRHWLDVVRYEQNRVRLKHQPKFRGELHYRDYVVRAFNHDKPYDRFIMEQIAGDLLEVIGDPDQDAAAKQRYFDQIIAPAFLSIGDWFDECTDPNQLRMDIVDDMIDTTGKVFMGLSLGCARCHDHPFDPVPTEDYYALGGIFKSTKIIGDFSEFWRDGRDRMTRKLATKSQVHHNGKQQRIIDETIEEIVKQNEKTAEYLASRTTMENFQKLAKEVSRPATVTVEAEDFAGVDNLKISTIRDIVEEFDFKSEGPKRAEATVIETQTPVLQWARYTFRLPKTGRYEIQLLYSARGPTPIDVQAGRNASKVALDEPIEGTGGWGLRFRAWQSVGTYQMSAGPNALRLTARVDPKTKTAQFPQIDKIRLVHVTAAWEAKVKKVAANTKMNSNALRHYLIHADSPYRFAMGKDSLASGWEAGWLEKKRAMIRKAQASLREYPDILAVSDELHFKGMLINRPPEAITDIPVHIRGDVYNTRDEPTPRGMLRLFDNTLVNPKMPADESGRLQLAVWLSHPKNPLTARVMVNRIWQWHFGEGLVATPNDFGTRGAKPTHPALLDWLADEFVKSGWSVKHIQKLICTSNTYRMASTHPKSEIQNPKWLSAFPRQRLSVEAIYDAMLCSIGKVRRQTSSPLDFNKSADRMMYVLTSNRSPKGLGLEIKKMFGVFDYQHTGVSMPKRDQTSTAAQSLWFMNNPLPRYYAEQLAARVLQLKQITEGERLEQVYVLALGRYPNDAVTRATMDYIDAAIKDGATREEAWVRVCLAVYSSNAFRYIE